MKVNLKFLSIFALSAFLIYSCSETASSGPSYKYKKAVGDGIAAKFGDVTITDKELYDGIEGELFDAQMKIFEIKFNKLNSLVLEKLMKADKRSEGLTNDEYMDKYIATTISISKADIDGFIKERKIPQSNINPQIEERIKSYLMIEKKKEAVEAWIAKQTGKSGIEVYFEKPRRPSYDVQVGNAPTWGADNAKVTIVEFSDFQCPFCAKGASVLSEIKKKYGKKVKIAFKQFPLPFHTQAKDAAIAALCAKEQKVDFFWKLHDEMFNDQSKLSVADIKATAKKIGLDSKKFDSCLDEKKFASQIDADIEQGKSVGVKSTPTFYVNGQLISGAQPLEVFSELIDQEL